MAWFFVDTELAAEEYTLSGEDALHIARSLRMKVGEALTLCTPDGKRHECAITAVNRDEVTVRILSSTVCEQEPTVRISLFISLMKGDKIDDVIQKSPRFYRRGVSRDPMKRALSKSSSGGRRSPTTPPLSRGAGSFRRCIPASISLISRKRQRNPKRRSFSTNAAAKSCPL